jgi:hypothetical protein
MAITAIGWEATTKVANYYALQSVAPAHFGSYLLSIIFASVACFILGSSCIYVSIKIANNCKRKIAV